MKQSGFTLIELVVVMIIVGILAVAAIPRMFDRLTFESRGFNDETIALLRYAQKTAIAQRRTVCVRFSATSVTLSIDSNTGTSTCSGASVINLTGPNGVSPYSVQARTGVSFATTPSNFQFDSLGRPSLATQTIQVSGVNGTITVEQETGYVHP